jgi:hypothetical protein
MMTRRPRTPIPLLLVAVFGLLLIGESWGASGAVGATAHRDTTGAPLPETTFPSGPALVHGVAAGPSVQITMPPAGLSVEYSVMAQDLGTGACPPPALVAELLRLGSPPLSLAGASQDLTAPAGALTGMASSWEGATLYSLPADFWSQLHCLLSAAGDPLTVGINLKTGELSWAAQMVAGARSAATNGLDFSLGNEPDRYLLPDYSSLDKPQPNEEALAVGLYLQLATAMQQALGGAPLIGPELSSPEHWRGQLPRVIAQLHEQTVGVHVYPLTTCLSPRAVTVGGLLSPSAADEPSRLAWVVADADAADVPAIISEANSASCGGKAGVSDSPAAAVWAVRFVLSALKSGFREVRFHFSGDPYDPFIVSGDQIVARPLESALVALNKWFPVGASLQTVGGVRGLLTTAVSGSASGVRLILDNERPLAQQVVLHTRQSVRTEVLSAAGAGLRTHTFSPTHGRVKLKVAENSVVAVLSGP